jgi:hypothetical protein
LKPVHTGLVYSYLGYYVYSGYYGAKVGNRIEIF